MRKGSGRMDNKMVLSILKLRKDIHELYKKHNRLTNLIWKGAGAFFLFLSLNSLYQNHSGMMLMLAVGLSLVCAVIPTRMIFPASVLFAVLHLWQISWDIALCYAALAVVAWILICRVRPDTAVILAYMPLLCFVKIPFLMPILVGMFSNLYGVGAMVFGIVFYFGGAYCGSAVTSLPMLLSSSGETGIAVQSVLAGLAGNADFMLLLGACVAAAVVTYVIYHQSFDYAWYISSVCGGIAGLIVYLAGGIMFEIEHVNMICIFTIPAAMCLACLVQFFRCLIDYTGVEYAEFEDDDFYYYVKAVPKINVIVDDFAMIGEKKKEAAPKEEMEEEEK